MSKRFAVVPLELAEANSFVRRHHRHHGPVCGHCLPSRGGIACCGRAGCLLDGRAHNEFPAAAKAQAA